MQKTACELGYIISLFAGGIFFQIILSLSPQERESLLRKRVPREELPWQGVGQRPTVFRGVGGKAPKVFCLMSYRISRSTSPIRFSPTSILSSLTFAKHSRTCRSAPPPMLY